MPIPIRRSVGGVLLGFICLNLLNCGAGTHGPVPPPGPGVGVEHCGGYACSVIGDCTAVAPVCANPTTIACPTTPTPRECVFSLKISAGCPCLEHDVRLCTEMGAPGVAICNKVTSTTTAWGSCQVTPACTP
jgi:hypothetical protein